MNGAVVARAVLTRIQADSTLYSGGAWTAACAGGVAFNRGNPSALVFPFIVYGITWTADNNFTGIEGVCNLTFTVYDEDARGLDRIEVLIDRLIGDAMIASGNRSTPTFGFHNHLLALPSVGTTNVQGATSERWTLIGSDIAPGESLQVNTATVTFAGRVGNQAVNV